MKRSVIIHYGEIGLKGAHEAFFVKKLRDQIRDRLQKRFKTALRVVESLSRIMIDLPESFDESAYAEVLREIFGIQNFSFVWHGDLDLEKLVQQIFENLPDGGFKNFCVRVKRSQPMSLSSSEIERELGAGLLRSGIDLPVRLMEPDLPINVEIFNDCAYFSFGKHDGAGGLPVGSAGKLLSLISSGFDSPVASYQMMRRGARIAFVHFSSYPYSDRGEQDQVVEIVKHLAEFQFDTRLWILPFGELQKKISDCIDIPARHRVVIYRRLMMMIASRLSYDEQAKGLITGDCLGQVASQTLENMFVVDAAAVVPVYRPLVSFDKEAVIELSRKIGVHDLSAEPCKESCRLFSPKKPEVRANLFEIQEFEKNLPIDDLIQEVLEGGELLEF